MRPTSDMLPTNDEFPVRTDRDPDPWVRCDNLEAELERARREIIFLRQQLAAQVNNANKFLAGREWRTDGDNLQKPYTKPYTKPYSRA